MAEEFELRVAAVFPRVSGKSEVRFQFGTTMIEDTILLDVQYLGDDGLDAAVKEAAGYLAEFAEQLAEEARAIAT